MDGRRDTGTPYILRLHNRDLGSDQVAAEAKHWGPLLRSSVVQLLWQHWKGSPALFYSDFKRSALSEKSGKKRLFFSESVEKIKRKSLHFFREKVVTRHCDPSEGTKPADSNSWFSNPGAQRDPVLDTEKTTTDPLNPLFTTLFTTSICDSQLFQSVSISPIFEEGDGIFCRPLEVARWSENRRARV